VSQVTGLNPESRKDWLCFIVREHKNPGKEFC